MFVSLSLRFGVIFSTRGGILPRLLPLYKLRFGARLGNGQQWMSWVSLYDAAQAILFLLEKGHEDIQVRKFASLPGVPNRSRREVHRVSRWLHAYQHRIERPPSRNNNDGRATSSR